MVMVLCKDFCRTRRTFVGIWAFSVENSYSYIIFVFYIFVWSGL